MKKQTKPQRPHKPEENGSRISKRGKWYYIDLRWLGGKRVVMRDPSAPGWPQYGDRTDDPSTARGWRDAYEKLLENGPGSGKLGRLTRYDRLEDACEAWLDHRRSQKGSDSSTVAGSVTAIGHLLDLYDLDADPRLVSKDDLQDWVNKRLSEGYSPRTVSGYVQHLRKFWEWLGGENPARGLEIPKADPTPVTAWETEGDREAIRAAAREIDARVGTEGPSRETLVELLFGTGVRIQEAAAARWEWLSRRTRTIRVSHQRARSGVLKPPKGGRARTATVLPNWWPHHRKKTGLIVANGDGSYVGYRDLNDILNEILEVAGLKVSGECAHVFRHTYSFIMLEAGISLTDLQKCLGHDSIRTTELYYDHWTSDHAARSAARTIYGEPPEEREE